jgi:hypothetical protein
MNPIGRKKGKGILSEDRRKVSGSLRNAKLPEVKKSKPDVHNEATNATGRNSGGTAGGETQNGGNRFQIITLVAWTTFTNNLSFAGTLSRISEQTRKRPLSILND